MNNLIPFVQPPVLSLVMATRGRSEPIARFLSAMRQQSVLGVELLIIDQNDDDRVAVTLAKHGEGVSARIIRALPGLSAARNLGAAEARADLIGFPDDDCWYTPGLLSAVVKWFIDHPEAHGLSCRVSDEHNRDSAGGFMSRRAQWITRRNVWRTAATPGLFVRREVLESIGGFDERMGVAANWGSGEETDFVLRAVRKQLRMFYDPSFQVFHPRREIPFGAEAAAHGWRYGRGAGFVLAKHGYSASSVAYYAAIPIAAAPLALLTARPGKMVERLFAGAGRMIGWIQAKRDVNPCELMAIFARRRDEAIGSTSPTQIPSRTESLPTLSRSSVG